MTAADRPAPIRVLLAEDVQILRVALAELLEFEDDLSVVAQVGSGDLIVPTAQRVQPDVAVLDVDLPQLDGLSAAEALHAQVPGCRTLILTGLGRPRTLQRALTMSVAGFLLKDASPGELVAAIRVIAGGGAVMDPHLAFAAWGASQCPLSDREVESLRLAANGAEPPEIAAAMHLSVGTVRNYLTAVVAKLNARNRVDAIRIAHEAGWL